MSPQFLSIQTDNIIKSLVKLALKEMYIIFNII